MAETENDSMIEITDESTQKELQVLDNQNAAIVSPDGKIHSGAKLLRRHERQQDMENATIASMAETGDDSRLRQYSQGWDADRYYTHLLEGSVAKLPNWAQRGRFSFYAFPHHVHGTVEFSQGWENHRLYTHLIKGSRHQLPHWAGAGRFSFWAYDKPMLGTTEFSQGYSDDYYTHLVNGPQSRLPSWAWRSRFSFWAFESPFKDRTIKARHGKCLDAPYRDRPGSKLHLWACDEENMNQMWGYNPWTGQIKNLYGICLDAPERDRPGSKVHMVECDTNNRNQQWAYDMANLRIQDQHGICLDAPEKNRDGGKVHMVECDANNANQHWDFKIDPTIGVRDGLCMDAAERNKPGGRVHMVECNALNQNQHWMYDGGTGQIKNLHGICLDANQRWTDGAKVHMVECNTDNENQQWLYNRCDGQIRIRNGLCLDAPHKKRPGSDVTMYACDTNNGNQQWYIHGASGLNCVGYFCCKKINEIFIVMTHNSLALPGKVFSPNQNRGLRRQFEDGIRGFMVDLYSDHGIKTHHGGKGWNYNPQGQFGGLIDAMRHKPDEFIVIQIQDDGLDPSDYDTFTSWFGHSVITNFDANRQLSEYIHKGQRVLIVTDQGKKVNPSKGIHHTSHVITENEYEWTFCHGRNPPFGIVAARMERLP